jgi:hypothetical protein
VNGLGNAPFMPFGKLRTGFDKALLSAVEGLSTNGALRKS